MERSWYFAENSVESVIDDSFAWIHGASRGESGYVCMSNCTISIDCTVEQSKRILRNFANILIEYRIIFGVTRSPISLVLHLCDL